MFSANVIGDSAANAARPSFVHGDTPPRKSIANCSLMSASTACWYQSYTPAPATAARQYDACPTSQLVCKPPPDQPLTPIRDSSTIPIFFSASTPAKLSRPGPLVTCGTIAERNASPWLSLPR